MQLGAAQHCLALQGNIDYWTGGKGHTSKQQNGLAAVMDSVQILPSGLGKPSKKNIESVSLRQRQRSHLLRFFFNMLQTYLFGTREPPKKIVFTPNSIFNRPGVAGAVL